MTSVPVAGSTQRCSLGTCGGKSAPFDPIVNPVIPRLLSIGMTDRVT
jgi:hypothetical protein